MVIILEKLTFSSVVTACVADTGVSRYWRRQLSCSLTWDTGSSHTAASGHQDSTPSRESPVRGAECNCCHTIFSYMYNSAGKSSSTQVHPALYYRYTQTCFSQSRFYMNHFYNMIQNTFWYVWLSYFKVRTAFCLEGIRKKFVFRLSQIRTTYQDCSD